MNPDPHTRLNGGPGSIYELVGPYWEDSRHAYLRARKLFRNFRYPAEALDEAPADESLDVLIRRPLDGDDPEGTGGAFERDSVLTLPEMPCFLEWIDLIEPEGGGPAGPWLVFADPHATPLSTSAVADPGTAVVLASGALAMLDALHRSGLAVGAMAPADFLFGGPERWFFLGTDRIHPAHGAEEARADLGQWARLTETLVCGGVATSWPSFDSVPAGLRDRSRWLFERVRLYRDGDPSDRPGSAAGLDPRPSPHRGPLAELRRVLGRRPRDET
jgi:hypothetical protein